ncbi:NYN domain-containing protein [Defluviitalea phaphyphila]|uniref:NYN domain-containing protein n=1 Tax=Defluviitalea phaphyphila TaxID=1473580 RepID=UPI000731029D|nr:NYN domain-containing protein [Defluviitalea phaphyphila]
MDIEYLLVDGYNIIHAWENLKELAEENLEQARDKLLEIMSNYQGFKKIKVIVVFDAHKVKGNIGKTYKYNQLDVVFTKEAETADNYIERTTHEIGQTYRIRVATSDGLEQIIILGKGATRISARELLDEVIQVENIIREKHIKKNKVERNTLESFMKPEVIEWMEKMRRNKGK